VTRRWGVAVVLTAAVLLGARRSPAATATTASSTVGLEGGFRVSHDETGGRGFGVGVSADRQLSELWRGSVRLSFLWLGARQRGTVLSVPLQVGAAVQLGPYVWLGAELGPTVWSLDGSGALGLSIEPMLGVRISRLELRWGGNLLFSASGSLFVSILAVGWRFSLE